MRASEVISRLRGDNELSPDAARAVAAWAQTSSALLRMLDRTSVISPDERVLVLALVESHLDSPSPVRSDLTTDDVYALQARLLRDAELYGQPGQDLEVEP